jgi:hypothetical protein
MNKPGARFKKLEGDSILWNLGKEAALKTGLEWHRAPVPLY